MPSEKRARQRAARQAKLAALERQRKRKTLVRRTVSVVVLAAVVIGGIALISSGHKSSSATHPTTTPDNSKATPTTSTTSVSLTGVTTSSNCPTPFSTATHLDKPSWTSPPKVTLNQAKTYTATIATDVGTIVVKLDAEHAPALVNNFVFLAEDHYYDCVVFHRVIQEFMDQTGDPTGSGRGGPGYKIDDENLPKNNSAYKAGVVAMANSGANTNSSQFFIMAGNSGLGPSYSIIGNVTSGMNVVTKINQDGSNPQVDTQGTGTPTVLHRMISVTIAET